MSGYQAPPSKSFRSSSYVPSSDYVLEDFEILTHDGVFEDLERLYDLFIYTDQHASSIHLASASITNVTNGRKRQCDGALPLDISDIVVDRFETASEAVDYQIGGLQDILQRYSPSIPEKDTCVPLTNVPNPYAPGGITQHAKYGRSKETRMISDAAVLDGLLKIRDLQLVDVVPVARMRSLVGKRSSESQNGGAVARLPLKSPTAPRFLPPGYGRVLKFDTLESRLLDFYLGPFCEGRTILPESNTFLNEIAPMAQTNPLVKHALLAVTATYYLDLKPGRELEEFANRHHRSAVRMIGRELNQSLNYRSGNEAAILAAIVLLNQDDVINWENRDVNQQPKWYAAIKLAKQLLQVSDPAVGYHHPFNVQMSAARLHIGAMLAEEDIFAGVVAPLDLSQNGKDVPHTWLTSGDPREQHKIRGLIGMCPKLLHVFAKTTQLCAELAQDPQSLVWPIVADRMWEMVVQVSVGQWSTLQHQPTPSARRLLSECKLDASRKLSDAAQVTAVGAESHACAARLYLLCRFYRYPISHRKVQRELRTLLRTIQISPQDGPLFTSQAPFFAVFMAGMIAQLPKHRQVVKDWFIPVVTGARGNVPPAWSAVQHVWKWNDLRGEGQWNPSTPVGERYPWWEDMVAVITRCEGQLALT